jgi:hypothetical protein
MRKVKKAAGLVGPAYVHAHAAVQQAGAFIPQKLFRSQNLWSKPASGQCMK